MAAANAHRIRLGTSVFSAPFHHPFHLAERMCFLDHLTFGRAILGVGPSSLVTDKRLFNMDDGTLYPMLHEAIEIIVRLLESSEPISHEGRFWKFQDMRLQLRSYQQPRMPLALPSAGTPANLDLIGRHGMIWMSPAGRTGRGGISRAEQWALVEKGARSAGRVADRSNWRIVTQMYLADTREQAWADISDGLMRETRYMSSIGFEAHSASHPGQRFDEFTPQSVVAARNWLVGTPDDAVAWIENMAAETGGFGGVMLTANEWTTFEKISRSIEMFARYVIPRFTGRSGSLADEWHRTERQWRAGQSTFTAKSTPSNLWGK